MLNPTTIQKAMMRVAKKLQEKVQRGELKPQELAAEAEELMKEFESHPAFVELMETFRSAFGTDNMQQAKAQGRESEARLSAIQKRLRKKAEEKALNKAGVSSAPAPKPTTAEKEEFPSILPVSKKGGKK
jgi:ParB-like chromosome segregation protein Spo0J